MPVLATPKAWAKRTWFRSVGGFASQRLPLSHQIAQSAKYFLTHYEYETGGPHHNGEEWLLRRLESKLDRIFDVGANKGEWSLLARRYHPAADLHAFEIVPQTFQKLLAASPPGVHLHNFGLSDQNGQVPIKYHGDHDTVSSAFVVPGLTGRDHAETVMCPVRAGDAFCDENGLDRIDLLKIDTEGAESLVLKGFAERLQDGRIPLIQFEYGLANIPARFLLADFYEMLGARYRIGMLTKRGVKFKDYSVRDETFMGPNYIALSRERTDLEDLLTYVASGRRAKP